MTAIDGPAGDIFSVPYGKEQGLIPGSRKCLEPHMLLLKSEMKQGSLRHASVGRSTGLISLMDLPSLRPLRIFGCRDGYLIPDGRVCTHDNHLKAVNYTTSKRCHSSAQKHTKSSTILLWHTSRKWCQCYLDYDVTSSTSEIGPKGLECEAQKTAISPFSLPLPFSTRLGPQLLPVFH
jgi:hypothetical protein